MGRKIPVRKHHGIRDPLKQNEEKEKKLNNLVDRPPEKENDQKVSFKFAQFKKLMDDTKAGKKVKRTHRGIEDKPIKKKENASEGNKFRNIKQFHDEADQDYLKRVNRITSESLREAQYEAKYGVNVVRDPKTGAITIKKRPRTEIDDLLKQKQKEKLGGKVRKKSKQANKPSKPMDPKVAKELIKQAIKEDEEEKRNQSSRDIQEYKRDVIKFGEIVHAPPTLSTLPRKAEKSETVPRPGRKNNLLLKSLLNPSDDSIGKTQKTAKSLNKKQNNTVTKAQMKGKRKDLPVATRMMLENEQSKMIELYRNLKKSKDPSS